MHDYSLLKGRPNALFVLDYGLFQVHSNGRIIGICGYALRTDAGEVVLIDGGFPAKYTQDPVAASAEDDLGAFGTVLQCGHENTATAQLARAGIAPDDISMLITTHTHIDHVGALHDFMQAPMVIAAAERALPRPLYWGAHQPLEWPERPLHPVDGDGHIGPGFDVYLTPGHAPGQLAFMVELPQTGAVLLTSDAISRPDEIDTKFEGAWDAHLALHHAERLMDIARARDALVIYGHDPAQWPTLTKAPEAYL